MFVADTEFTDTGLLPFTWYEYRVSSDNGYGTALSPGVLYRSAAGLPTGNFTARVEVTQATSVSVSWTAPTSPNGVIQRYVLTSFDEARGASVTVYSGLSLGRRVTGLTPYSRYVLTVSTCTGAGCLNTSVTAVTLQAPPSGQSPPHISASGATGLNVSWQPPTRPNGNHSHVDAQSVNQSINFCI